MGEPNLNLDVEPQMARLSDAALRAGNGERIPIPLRAEGPDNTRIGLLETLRRIMQEEVQLRYGETSREGVWEGVMGTLRELLDTFSKDTVSAGDLLICINNKIRESAKDSEQMGKLLILQSLFDKPQILSTSFSKKELLDEIDRQSDDTNPNFTQ